ncbi:MAG: hypothetical protein ACOX3W_06950 [Christensenellaceae bacterium]|jgi:hypothetical protein
MQTTSSKKPVLYYVSSALALLSIVFILVNYRHVFTDFSAYAFFAMFLPLCAAGIFGGVLLFMPEIKARKYLFLSVLFYLAAVLYLIIYLGSLLSFSVVHVSYFIKAIVLLITFVSLLPTVKTPLPGLIVIGLHLPYLLYQFIDLSVKYSRFNFYYSIDILLHTAYFLYFLQRFLQERKGISLPNENAIYYCVRCGLPFSPTAAFCSVCGSNERAPLRTGHAVDAALVTRAIEGITPDYYLAVGDVGLYENGKHLTETILSLFNPALPLAPEALGALQLAAIGERIFALTGPQGMQTFYAQMQLYLPIWQGQLWQIWKTYL